MKSLGLLALLGSCTTLPKVARSCIAEQNVIHCTDVDLPVYHPEYHERCGLLTYPAIGKIIECDLGYTFIPEATCQITDLPDFGYLITCSKNTQILIDRRYKRPRNIPEL